MAPLTLELNQGSLRDLGIDGFNVQELGLIPSPLNLSPFCMGSVLQSRSGWLESCVGSSRCWSDTGSGFLSGFGLRRLTLLWFSLHWNVKPLFVALSIAGAFWSHSSFSSLLVWIRRSLLLSALNTSYLFPSQQVLGTEQ